MYYIKKRYVKLIITIDTAKDSVEDIRKAVKFLSSFVEVGHYSENNSVSNDELSVESSPVDNSGMMGMFSESKSEEKVDDKVEENKSPGYVDMFSDTSSNKSEEKDEKDIGSSVHVEEY